MKKILISIGVVIAILIGVYAYNGGFSKADVRIQHQGELLVVGMDHKGAYKNIGTAFEKVTKIKETAKLDSAVLIGVYLDDPKTVAEESLRSFAGFTVPNMEVGTAICKNNPGCYIMPLEEGEAYVCDLKTSGTLSMIIAAMKAYPALGDAAEGMSTNKKVTHVYEMYLNGFTRFVMQFD
jgi:DNA gyrase inhibitor GyrI